MARILYRKCPELRMQVMEASAKPTTKKKALVLRRSIPGKWFNLPYGAMAGG